MLELKHAGSCKTANKSTIQLKHSRGVQTEKKNTKKKNILCNSFKNQSIAFCVFKDNRGCKFPSISFCKQIPMHAQVVNLENSFTKTFLLSVKKVNFYLVLITGTEASSSLL